MRKLILTSCIITLSACASLNTPNASLIETVPVVKIGEENLIKEEHIVFIPAYTKFPIHFSATGNIFHQEVSSKVMASLKHDLYLYQYWASLDGRKWVNSHQLMDVRPSGGFDKSGGKVEIQLNIPE